MDALGSMANADAIAIIKKHFNDSDASVKQHAAEALKAATEAAAEDAAKEAAANPEPAPKNTGKGQATGRPLNSGSWRRSSNGMTRRRSRS